ncbi:hypothetical protein C7212DRAFT_307787 [Tuber magnatum]|uniref:Uncharacterized protein n=1 Tax=Tuber magnatum TaxID=42249 RepID=A0A317SZT4_9PEZI|nr:hypothetical protein C7212DRAFT_307787 [Tuber magnatum]
MAHILHSSGGINAYLTSWALTMVGAGKPRMLLPAWILIALWPRPRVCCASPAFAVPSRCCWSYTSAHSLG